jgi:hypothetical protein
MLQVALPQQILAVIVAVRRPHHRVNMPARRASIVNKRTVDALGVG